jgi:hypothetical protein
MATMTTTLSPLRARHAARFNSSWAELAQRPGATRQIASQLALAELFPDVQAAADAALADLFPALRVQSRVAARASKAA